jgi:hypothetical protein
LAGLAHFNTLPLDHEMILRSIASLYLQSDVLSLIENNNGWKCFSNGENVFLNKEAGANAKFVLLIQDCNSRLSFFVSPG